MKELSIEQKARRYDEAIEIAREINNEQRAQPFNVMTRVFPELRESEDERIRKEIIAHIKWCEDSGYCAKEEMTRWITFLEKQGDQKPTENKGMNLKEEEMTPFQKEVFYIIDTNIEAEVGLKQECDELLRLAHDEIIQNTTRENREMD